MESNDPIERKRAIIDRLKNGESQTRIAKDCGVSRQAIHQLWQRYQEFGEYAILTPGRGRLKEKDLLTNEEKKHMIDWVKEHTPEDIGEKADRWNLKLVKRAILVELNKRVKIPIAHGVYHTAFPDRSAPAVKKTTRRVRKKASPSPKPQKKPEEPTPSPEPRKVIAKPAPASSETDDGFPSIEEMRRINEKTVEDADIDLPPFPTKTAPGVRVGKHAKGSKSPRQKPKRKKRKKR